MNAQRDPVLHVVGQREGRDDPAAHAVQRRAGPTAGLQSQEGSALDGRTKPYVVPPGGTRLEHAVLPFKALASDTGGAISVCEFHLEPWASGPVLHKHHAIDEGFFVIAGLLEAQVGDDRIQVPAGSFLWVPRGVPHTFANAGPEPLQVLALALPGGIERLFAEQAAYIASLHGDDPDPGVLDEIGERHGAATLGPPIRAGNPDGPVPPFGDGVQ